MIKKKSSTKLKLLKPSQIIPNPENPRLIFRQEEMESLLISIAKHGVQVPITVYQDKNDYYLIDGERRWRCAKKLNLQEIPSLVQDKPTELENLLLMSNIHALREQWDYFTIASNLHRIIELYEQKNNEEPNEIVLSEATGLTRGQIRRCHLLLGLPDRFKDILLTELELPKSQQKVTEDFLIEMEKSLKTVTKRLPEFDEQLDDVRDALLLKYRKGTISAVTDFRQLSKIATAIDTLGVKQRTAKKAIQKIFNPNNNVSIRDIYHSTVEFRYDERKATQHIEYLTEYFDQLLEEERELEFDEDFIVLLKELHKKLGKMIRR